MALGFVYPGKAFDTVPREMVMATLRWMGVLVSVEDVCRSDVLDRIKDRLHKHAKSAKMSPRTASLWVQYMGMIDILRKYVMGRAHWKLGTTFANHPEHASPLPGSLGPQPVH